MKTTSANLDNAHTESSFSFIKFTAFSLSFVDRVCSVNVTRCVSSQLDCCGPTGTVLDDAKDTCPSRDLLAQLITKVRPPEKHP